MANGNALVSVPLCFITSIRFVVHLWFRVYNLLIRFFHVDSSTHMAAAILILDPNPSLHL
ncbi:hypothetical protein BDV23DRAFT_155150 [Aspergillus alliaceus]|uniref:Uncharacterized protein n=1 Tax=Petromyces alliaceus TaxID=209559 RepID=A0A5N7CAA1_PETAA|nr:hypothetical protein BDV23DRAFT_155150 [Aspergillus alliaceus]